MGVSQAGRGVGLPAGAPAWAKAGGSGAAGGAAGGPGGAGGGLGGGGPLPAQSNPYAHERSDARGDGRGERERGEGRGGEGRGGRGERQSKRERDRASNGAGQGQPGGSSAGGRERRDTNDSSHDSAQLSPGGSRGSGGGGGGGSGDGDSMDPREDAEVAAAATAKTPGQQQQAQQQRTLVESPTTRLAFKEFYRQFRAKEKAPESSGGGPQAARQYAEECLEKELLPRKVHWRLYLELADLAKRENLWTEARRLYFVACSSQPFAAQGWLEWAKMEEERGQLGRCVDSIPRTETHPSEPSTSNVPLPQLQHQT